VADTKVDEIDLEAESPPDPKMTCTSTKCEENLHCFRPKKPRKQKSQPGDQSIQLLLFDDLSLPGPGEEGRCRSCGKQLVDWTRIHKRNLADASYTVEMLKLELWRYYNWHRPIDAWALNRARRRGCAGLRDEAEKVVRTKLAPGNPPFDGRQTRKEGNVIFYAQHATGTCCRKCLRYWHGIEMGRELSDEEVTFVVGWIQLYIGQRLPDLAETGVKVPYIREKRIAPKG
jgi:Domain of unknown function (DUF4186)